MSSNRGSDTKPELKLRKALWKLGFRYRKNYKGLPGTPDIVFLKRKIAIFVDGDFWHGNNWKLRGRKSLEDELNRYRDYWREKILRNIERDKRVTKDLEKDGWKVLRYWESDINQNLRNVLSDIIYHYNKSS